MFEDKMGFNQHLLTDDPVTREGIHNWLERVLGFYGEKEGGVDVEVIEGQLLLNETSADYIYSDFTPLEIKYEKGSRPLLEQVVNENTDENMNDMEKMLALMRKCRDNRDNKPSSVTFTGGNEEELLKRGAIMCNEIHRVFACLCQISGIPARLMGTHISGHMMSEVYVNSTWMWVDCMKGNYCFNDNGTPASTWDLMQDPEIIDRQTKKVWDDCRPVGLSGLPEFLEWEKAFTQAKIRECYFNPKEATVIGNYYAWDVNKYTFPWRTEAADPVRLENARIAEARFREKHGWPDFYANNYLFDGVLKTKD
jgi:hypothetical protein